MIGAAEVGTLGRISNHIAVGELDYPGSTFLADHAPAIHAISPERDLQRNLGKQPSEISRLNPIVLAADFGGHQQVSDRRYTERSEHHCPETVNGSRAKI